MDIDITPHGSELGSPTDYALSGNPREQLREMVGWVFACVRTISQRIAGQPIRVGQVTSRAKPRRMKDAMGDAKAFDQHPFLDLLADPNPAMASFQVVQNWAMNLELTGLGTLLFDVEGDEPELWPLPSSWLQPIHREGRAFDAWKLRPDWSTTEYTVDGSLIAMASYPHPANPFQWLSPLRAAAPAVAADNRISAAQIKAFDNGMHPQHAIIVGDDVSDPSNPNPSRPRLTEDQYQQFITQIRKRYRGMANYGEPIVLDNLILDIKSLTNTPAEMGFLESSNLVRERIMQAFGVSPTILGQIEFNSRAASAEAEKHFVKNTINPKLELLGQCLTTWCRPLYEDDKLVVWFEPAEAVDSEEARANVLAAVQCGSITQNEARQILLGLPPQKGGDVLIGPASIGPMDDADEPQQSEEGTEP